MKNLRTVPMLLAVLLSANVAMAAKPMTVAQIEQENVRPRAELPPARSSHDPIPPAPSPIVGKGLRLVRQAGIGGPVAYARSGVMELGGGLAFSYASDNTILSVTPSIGHFITDNLELSILGTVAHTRTRTVKATSVIAVVEPSVHLPLVDHFFVFGGMGVGVAYHQGRGTGVALAPRVGFNALVGRSGILTPAFNVNWSSNSAIETANGDRAIAVHTTYGASINYSVML